MGDILIKGMEMPKSCACCDIACRYYLDHGLDGLLAKICRAESRLPDCPLVPVPPHGDLVDRDETIKAGKSHPTYKNSKIVKAVVDKACCFLKTATVVIPANKEN